MIGLGDISGEQAIIAGTATAVLGIVTVTLKSLVWDKKNLGASYIDGWEKRGDDLAGMRADFEDRINKIEAHYAESLAKVEAEVKYLRHALVRIVPLVRDDKIAEAVAILASYGLPELAGAIYPPLKGDHSP